MQGNRVYIVSSHPVERGRLLAMAAVPMVRAWFGILDETQLAVWSRHFLERADGESLRL